VPSSTLGYERLVNWAFGHDEEAGFVGAVLEDQPEPPRYFATMKHLNRVGPPILGGLTEPECLEASRLPDVLAEGGIVVDCREREAFAAGHIPGTLLVPLNRSFCTWAGSLLPYDRPIHLLAPSRAAAVEAARRLAFIGLDRVAGYFGSEAFAEATLAEADVVSVQRAHELHREGGFLLDIRRATEWRAGHVPGAHHRHLGALVEDRSGLPDDTAVLLLCRSGARSAIAQSLLLAEGRRAINVEGGIEAWIGEGLPVGR